MAPMTCISISFMGNNSLLSYHIYKKICELSIFNMLNLFTKKIWQCCRIDINFKWSINLSFESYSHLRHNRTCLKSFEIDNLSLVLVSNVKDNFQFYTNKTCYLKSKIVHCQMALIVCIENIISLRNDLKKSFIDECGIRVPDGR